jgi:hypothetical protein
MSKLKRRPSPALVVSMIALFVALGSGAYAASKIDTQDIKKKAVTGPKIDKDAIKSGKVKNGKLKGKDLADETISESKLGEGVVTTDKIQDAAVAAGKIGPVEIRTNTVTVNVDTKDVVAVSCLPGEILLGGGGGFDIVTAAPHPSVIMSQPQNNTTWRVRGFNPSLAFDRVLTVKAICLEA